MSCPSAHTRVSPGSVGPSGLTAPDILRSGRHAPRRAAPRVALTVWSAGFPQPPRLKTQNQHGGLNPGYQPWGTKRAWKLTSVCDFSGVSLGNGVFRQRIPIEKQSAVSHNNSRFCAQMQLWPRPSTGRPREAQGFLCHACLAQEVPCMQSELSSFSGPYQETAQRKIGRKVMVYHRR